MSTVLEEPRGVITDNDIQTLERRETVIRLRAQRMSLPQIARQIGCSPSIVQQDLRYIRAEWQRKVARNRSIWLADILAEIEQIREIALNEFFESDKPTKENMVENGEKGSRNRRSRKTRGKDPRYLAICQEADKQRVAILGIGDRAARDSVDEFLGKKRPKLLVIRDRQQARDLVDITKLMEIESLEPVQDGEVVDGQVIFPEGEGPQ